jgi:cbb3-type cytochrome oxidase maturation protein
MQRAWPNIQIRSDMDILYLLIPLSIVLALLILGALGWAVWRGQFDDVDAEGERILRSD